MSMQKIIDVHSHPHPDNRGNQSITHRLKENGLPYIEDRQEGIFLISERDGIVRPVDEELLSPELMLEKMKQFNIVHQLKLASPWTFRYDMQNSELAVWMANQANLNIQEDWVGKYPKSFSGACTVPLQFIDASIELLQECAKAGFRVVTIGTSVNRQPLHLPIFDPFWKAVSDLGMVVYVHPHEMRDEQDNWMQWLEEMPYRTAQAMNAFMIHGILDRFPDLKVIFSHGGTTWFSSLGRKQYGHKVRPDLVSKDPLRHLGKIFVDAHTCSVEELYNIINLIGEEHVIYGADSPFALGDWPTKHNPQQVPGADVRKLYFPYKANWFIKEKILFKNAQELLQLNLD